MAERISAHVLSSWAKDKLEDSRRAVRPAHRDTVIGECTVMKGLPRGQA
jgi:hypothetical protein